jgi:MFS family permease
VLPFEVIYLHDGRGLRLGVAGLVVGVMTGFGVVAAPLAGPLIDRFGARVCAAAAGVALAGGYAWLAFVHSPLPAFAPAVLAGAGNGALNPSQSALIAGRAPSEVRHRATAVSRVATNAGFGLGGALGGLVAARGPGGFVVLFLVNAITYLVYVVVLLLAVRREVRPERAEGGYRAVLRDRAFVYLAGVNVAIIAAGWGGLPWLVPSFATHSLGVGAQLIGLLLLANAATVVLAQVPIARLAEGRRRTAMMAAGGASIAGAFLLVALSQAVAAAYPLLVVAAVGIAVGECLHTAALMPLVADLAPAGLRGRYMGAIALSWWVGLAAAPTLGTQLLSVSATLTFLACAGVAGAAAVSLLRLERRLPGAVLYTPRPAVV